MMLPELTLVLPPESISRNYSRTANYTFVNHDTGNPTGLPVFVFKPET